MQKENLHSRLKPPTKYEATESNNEKENYSVKKEDMESHRLKASKGPKKDKFRCRVAVFDEKENPNQKAMYPKNLVYVDGKDIQLEEIRAMHYWNKVKTKGAEAASRPDVSKKFRDISTQTDVETLQREVEKVQLTENYTQTDSNSPEMKETCAQTSFSMCKYSQTDSPKVAPEMPKEATPNNEISIQTSPLAFPFVEKNKQSMCSKASKVAAADFEIAPSEVPVVAKFNETIFDKSVKQKPEESRFIRGSGVTLPDEDLLDDENDTLVDTRAFKILPSSTPFHASRRFTEIEDEDSPINFEIVKKAESIHHTKSPVNLSMIVELSKEIYSQSTTESRIDGICSRTFVVPNHRVSHQNEETDSENFNLRSVNNPFDDNLIEHLLLSLSFPADNHLPGYSHYDSDVPNFRSRSSIKLGSDKYTVCGEIGEGAYARILKIHPENNAIKPMALKHQEPPCLWEWYINKEIFSRLIEADKKQYFIEYSKIYVFKNASLILSDWAPYGNILNLLNTLKEARSLVLKDRCPMSVCLHLSIQMISCIKYLHSCEIIHGDVKPDNFVLVPCASNTSLRIKLIDFGRSIDMKLFPPSKTFNYVVNTENFTCNEMKENKPWTYQTDLFGLAGTMYILIIGKYMNTQKRDGVWGLDKTWPRYFYPDIWIPIFNSLLNIPSCSQLPNLSDMKKNLESFLNNKIGKFTLSREMNAVLTVLNKK